MNDLISRRAAIDGFYKMASDIDHLCTVGDYISFLESLSAQPEIIRCKDCKCGDWYTAIDGNRYCYCMETGNGGRTEDDYCSYAERLEE